MSVRPAKTQISLGKRPIWSESSLSAWRKLGSLAIRWAHSEDSDQTGRMPRLIWVFAGRKATLLILSCRGSNVYATIEYNAAGLTRPDMIKIYRITKLTFENVIDTIITFPFNVPIPFSTLI